jgi:dienelactone hydrolase
LIALAFLVLCAGTAVAQGTTETLDFHKFASMGMPASLKVTLYRPQGVSGPQPLIVIVPASGTKITDDWFARQAAYFTKAGYVVAVPQFDGLYGDANQAPMLEPGTGMQLREDLLPLVTPYAMQLLATVATLSQPGGPATGNHAVIGQELGSIVAARYAALNVPGLKAFVVVSPGFGVRGLSEREHQRSSRNTYRTLGAQVKVPSLWLYAKGNHRVSEADASELFDTYHAGGAPATLDVLPEIGMDGDALFSHPAAPTSWQEPVSKFLDAAKLR